MEGPPLEKGSGLGLNSLWRMRKKGRAVVLLRRFEEGDQGAVLAFLEECLPQSGRTWDPAGRHRLYGSIGASFDDFWCLLDGGNVVGTAALKKLDRANAS